MKDWEGANGSDREIQMVVDGAVEIVSVFNFVKGGREGVGGMCASCEKKVDKVE